jgi:hypothetical protein
MLKIKFFKNKKYYFNIILKTVDCLKRGWWEPGVGYERGLEWVSNLEHH